MPTLLTRFTPTGGAIPTMLVALFWSSSVPSLPTLLVQQGWRKVWLDATQYISPQVYASPNSGERTVLAALHENTAMTSKAFQHK